MRTHCTPPLKGRALRPLIPYINNPAFLLRTCVARTVKPGDGLVDNMLAVFDYPKATASVKSPTRMEASPSVAVTQ